MIDPLLLRLDDARRHHRRIRLADAAARVLAMTVAGLAVWVLADVVFLHRIFQGGAGDTVARAVLLAAVLLGAGVVAYRRFLPEWRTRRSDDAVAVLVERAHPSLGGRLISAVQLARVGAGSFMSEELIGKLVASSTDEAAPLDFRAITEARPLARQAVGLVLAGAVVAGLAAGWPAHARAALHRLALLDADYPTATRLIAFAPAPVSASTPVLVAQGEALALRLELDPTGYLPATAEVEVVTADRQRATVRLTSSAEAPQVFTGSLPRVAGDCRIRPSAYDAWWPRWIAIQALEQPVIIQATATTHPPAYLGDAGQTGPLGDLTVPAGTRITLAITCAAPITQAEIEVAAGDAPPVRLPATVDPAGTHAKATMEVAVTSVVRVHLTDAHGLTNPEPVGTTFTALPDAPPVVVLTAPVRDLSATRISRWPLRFTAKDDHGLQDAVLRWQVEDGNGEPLRVALPPVSGAAEGKTAFTYDGILDVSQFKAAPGTRIVFWIEASDRRPQVGASQKRTVTIVDPAQLKAELAAAQAAAVEALVGARDRQKELALSVQDLGGVAPAPPAPPAKPTPGKPAPPAKPAPAKPVPTPKPTPRP